GASPDVGRTHLLEPMTVDRFVRYMTPLTHNVWTYRDEEEAQRLANKFVDALVDNVKCENGVVDTFNWCLYEVMDNVFQHSGANEGYVMMQLHKDSRRCAIAIGDSGSGIQLSMVRSTDPGLDRAKFVNADDAI